MLPADAKLGLILARQDDVALGAQPGDLFQGAGVQPVTKAAESF
jgi:hypothetical protein